MTNVAATLTDYRAIGDVPLAVIKAELLKVASPMLATAEATHAAASPHSALFWAQAWLENQWETTGHILKPEHHNPVSIRPPYINQPGPFALGVITAPDGGQFERYASDALGVMEWRRRLFDDPTYKGGIYAKTKTLEQMLAVYAPAGDIHPITGVDNAGINYAGTVTTVLKRFAALEAQLKPAPEREDTAPMAKPYILIVAGHRSTTDPGNPTERDRTDDMARAYVAQFKAAGYTVGYWQNQDADTMMDMTVGSLDTVATGVRNHLLARKESMAVMLDLHFNMAESSYFCIVPDVGRLKSGYRDGAPADDTATNNVLDMKVAKAISAHSSKALGGKALYNGILGVRGVMSEKETYVATSGGWRLGMFGSTAVVRHRAVRLVVEHGGYNDFTRYDDFSNKCAKAAVAAINEVFGVASTPTKDPEPVPAPTPTQPPAEGGNLIWPAGLDAGVASVLFGEAKANTGAVYKFDPNGDISRAWLARGKETGQYPALVSVQVYSEGKPEQRQYFQFSDGHTLWRPSSTDAFRALKS